MLSLAYSRNCIECYDCNFAKCLHGMNSNRMVVTQRGVLPPAKYNYADSAWFKYILSCTAATTAELVTYPLDLAKTRLQIQGETELNSKGSRMLPYRGLVGTAVGIVREEGFLKLWQGMTPAVYRHLVYSGTRMVLYEKLRDNLFSVREDGSHPVWQSIMGGIVVGGAAQLLASPADLIKVQLQMEGRRRLEGKPPRVTNVSEAFVKIYTSGGVRGLWKGCMPNVYRSALVNLGDLTTYDSVKRFFIKRGFTDDYWTHALSSACSGLIGASLGTPADVVKSRVMNQPTDHRGRGLLYKSSMDCLLKTVHNEGFWALYKGFLPCWMRMGPWSLTFWLTYEQIRSKCGTSAF
ncbi:mitochondrial uncoupling protein 4 isoform X1 [Hyalella azteca]|uniref:Mitochondrial uncoupling protein 4 isoform X1 n=3 Tax=Hyalella azteca TaxID=294128 RepID=A0A979FP42_HYAAZ|nr:mitochondrial uncoupling protein 4 isoform X1 [Hyalella azteca]